MNWHRTTKCWAVPNQFTVRGLAIAPQSRGAGLALRALVFETRLTHNAELIVHTSQVIIQWAQDKVHMPQTTFQHSLRAARLAAITNHQGLTVCSLQMTLHTSKSLSLKVTENLYRFKEWEYLKTFRTNQSHQKRTCSHTKARQTIFWHYSNDKNFVEHNRKATSNAIGPNTRTTSHLPVTDAKCTPNLHK